MEPVTQLQAAKSNNATNQHALRRVRAHVIEVNKATGETKITEPGASNAVPDDPLDALAHAGKVIEAPFDLLTLAMLPEHNSELGQCIEAMETNIEGYGHRFIAPKRDATDESDPPEVKKEWAQLTNFFEYATAESFVAFRRKLRKDLETTGNAYFEVVRGQEGEIQGFTHIASYQMRLGRMDEEPILVDRKVTLTQEDGTTKPGTRKEYRRFRRFVQSRTIHRRTLHAVMAGGKICWFKEFGDPRILHKKTGDFGTPEQVPVNERATEMIHMRLYSSRTPYGLPRFIGNLLSIFGDRAAEEINYVTFKNNNIPSMVVAVSNGQLTEGTVQRIKDFVQSQIQGSDNYSKFLIIEAESADADEGEDGGQVKVDIKPLVGSQHKDALFQNYSNNNQDKVRRAYRLPPIFVGRSDDYTRATAEASRRLADEQVFAPERIEFDALMNRVIFPEMGIQFHRYRTNSPNTTDNSRLVSILATSEKTGGMTPRIARHVLEEILSEELPPFPADFPADVPFSFTMAEAVKNMADTSEPGQQVTALKALADLGLLGGDGSVDLSLDPEEGMEAIAKKLKGMTQAVEKLWKDQNLGGDD